MKANDLRIGNWVLTCIPDMEIMIPHLKVQIQEITFNGFAFGNSFKDMGFTMPPYHVSGIPLTPEILEQCGFINNEGDNYRLMLHENLFLDLDKDGDTFNIFIRQIDLYNHMDVILFPEEMNYVHQLQNLYHALTFKELEIDLNKTRHPATAG